ncbi:hypothetical protein Tco_1293953 [Tanacetum coccineum]
MFSLSKRLPTRLFILHCDPGDASELRMRDLRANERSASKSVDSHNYDNESSDDDNDDDDVEKDEEDEEEHLASADLSAIPTDDPVPSS